MELLGSVRPGFRPNGRHLGSDRRVNAGSDVNPAYFGFHKTMVRVPTIVSDSLLSGRLTHQGFPVSYRHSIFIPPCF